MKRTIKFKFQGGVCYYVPCQDGREMCSWQHGGTSIGQATRSCQQRFGADYKPIQSNSDIDAGELATMPGYDC